ncbi:antizyme inhibitor 2-like isoform X1 [Lepisosteus oculatus]|uniref:antizyme inhibitor 2-like isoform X1 n=1 Tax=Lepisosteus oculatus TaxID=7918 RepID=UPI0035F51401
MDVEGRFQLAVLQEGQSSQDWLERETEERSRVGRQDAFLVADLGEVVLQHQRWHAALPRVRPFYAVKCNSSPGVLWTLAQLGTGFDCASQGEMQLVLALGVPAHRIVFAQPCKQLSHLQFAAKHDVQLATFDSQEELRQAALHHPRAQLLLRIATDDSTSMYRLSVKYGAPLGECGHLLELARELGVEVIGVSFHVGSGCQDPQAFSLAMADARSIFTLGQQLGHSMTLLDIGGGFPGTDHTGVTLEELAVVINTALELHFPAGSGVEVISEPGRYYVTSAFTLAASVIGKKEAAPCLGGTEGERHLVYHINDGLFGSFGFTRLEKDKYAQPSPLSQQDGRPLYPSTVWGPTCCPYDLLSTDWLLPELELGDWLLFFDHGAYSISMASHFNGFAPPPVLYTVPRLLWKCLQKRLLAAEELSSPEI